jgi:hypothetical protein
MAPSKQGRATFERMISELPKFNGDRARWPDFEDVMMVQVFGYQDWQLREVINETYKAPSDVDVAKYPILQRLWSYRRKAAAAAIRGACTPSFWQLLEQRKFLTLRRQNNENPTSFTNALRLS